MSLSTQLVKQPVVATRVAGARRAVRAHAKAQEGFRMMRSGVKEAADETLLTPRFYTTDFDEMEELFSTEINPNLDMVELQACLEEFRNDYNQKHFVRNNTFKDAADKIEGDTRKIFVEFLERSCTAEFSGFLLYKELGRRMKQTSPDVAEIFTLMSRDEARHAGFINKAMSDFNLALDLGFLTRNRKYTFFKPKFILYATYLSEKIGYWRYISIYRHLQRNPDNQLYPMFEYFENWCQDESRHGDFLAACLKARPELLNNFQSQLWCKFFCLTVYATMYLNDHQRTLFYESLGMNTTEFNQHVIRETNETTKRIFTEVPDVENPEFFKILDRAVELNRKLNSLPRDASTFEKLPIMLGLLKEFAALFFMPGIRTGSLDFENETAMVY